MYRFVKRRAELLSAFVVRNLRSKLLIELRTLRETAALRKGVLRMGYASDCRFYAKGVRKISPEKLFCGWVRRSTASCLAKKVPRKRSEKHGESIPNPSENRPKTCPEAPSNTGKHQQRRRAAFLVIFLLPGAICTL